MLQSSKSTPFSWNAGTSSNIAANTKGRASTTNQTALTTWATATWSIWFPPILSIAEDIVCCICDFAGRRNIASNKWYKAHLQDYQDKEKMFLWDFVDWIDVTNISYSILVKDGLLETDWNSEKGREAFCHISAHLPTLLVRICFPYLTTLFWPYNCFLEHLVKHIVVSDSYSRSSFDKDQ